MSIDYHPKAFPTKFERKKSANSKFYIETFLIKFNGEK